MRTIVLLFFIPLSLISQENKYEIDWKSNFIFESNSLNKDFLNTMLYGGYISEEMKNNWIALGNENNNIINAQIRNGFSFKYNLKNGSIGFSFSDVNILNTNFSDNLLHLLLKGNYNFQGETLDLSNTSMRASRFQQYKILFSKEIENTIINGGLSYLSGNHHASYILGNSYIYTAPFGTSLDIEYNINAFITDTSNLSAFVNNGNGIAIDLSTELKTKNNNIHFSISDLGFIMWNESSITFATDSIFNFQGIEVDNIFNFNDSILETYNTQDHINETRNISFKSYIPATLLISLSGNTESKYLSNYNAGIIAKWQPYMDNKLISLDKIKQGFTESNYKPLYYINSLYHTRFCDIKPSISYGGFTEDTKIGLAILKGKKNKFVIGTHNLGDIFNGDNTKAVSLYFNIKIRF